MINFLLLQKMSRVPLKKRFRLVNIISGICSYILTLPTCKKTCALAIICNLDYRWLAFRHHFRWFPMVIDGFRWLSMVIEGYRWFKYILNRLRICNYHFRHLQKSSAVRGQIM